MSVRSGWGRGASKASRARRGSVAPQRRALPQVEVDEPPRALLLHPNAREAQVHGQAQQFVGIGALHADIARQAGGVHSRLRLGPLDGMIRAAVARGDGHRLAVDLAQRLEPAQEHRAHFLHAAVTAPELCLGEVGVIGPADGGSGCGRLIDHFVTPLNFSIVLSPPMPSIPVTTTHSRSRFSVGGAGHPLIAAAQPSSG